MAHKFLQGFHAYTELCESVDDAVLCGVRVMAVLLCHGLLDFPEGLVYEVARNKTEAERADGLGNKGVLLVQDFVVGGVQDVDGLSVAVSTHADGLFALRQLAAFHGLRDGDILRKVRIRFKVAHGDADHAAFVVLGHGGSFREDVRHVPDCRFDKTDRRAFDSVAHGLVVDGDIREAGAARILKHFLAHQIKIARAREGHLVTGFDDCLLLCRHGDCGAFGCGDGDRRGGQIAVAMLAKFCRNIVIVVVFHFSLPLLVYSFELCIIYNFVAVSKIIYFLLFNNPLP